ncbi:Glutaconate CoA-transferase subunit A [Pelotomaculum schinkii]|uniref:Glutaconate CoA-transferase subunit A n=2 Tax=Pelotomaculum schinkii TaxID=78350 RepID=A0A4Y7R733_9FIRM|nr:CoA-transferase [Pelotomaculum schinkii]TEB04451.1 Glutaconate CoA-transferase subunit A [Pelotomaculum schinkii]
MSMEEAISKFVHNGDCIALGGFVTNRKPYAAVYEIMRQGIKNLYIEGGPAGGDVDMLIGAGCVKVLFNSYLANSGYSQVCRRFRKAIEEGEILWEDYSLDVQPIIYHAAALGLPYVAVKNMLGSSLVEKWGIPEDVWENDPKLAPRKLIIERNPFNPEEQVCLLPTPKIDTAIIHVQKASTDGTCRIEGAVFVDIDIAMGATNCIVTCEELVHPSELRREPWLNQLPNIVPDAVVHVPYGAHPSQCANYYDYDANYYKLYDRVSGDDQKFKEFLDEWVYGVKNQSEYMNKLGFNRFANLWVRPGYGYAAGLKRG